MAVLGATADPLFGSRASLAELTVDTGKIPSSGATPGKKQS